MSDDLTQYFKSDEAESAEVKAQEASAKIISFFDNDKGKEMLEMISNMFECHIPSMAIPEVNFDPIKAAYRDGQKSVVSTLNQIIDKTIL